MITQADFGGAQRFVFQLLSKLDSDKFEAIVAVGTCNGMQLFKQGLRRINIPVHHLKHLQRSINPYHDIKAVGELQELIEEFDPQTLFLLSSKAGAVGSFAARRFKFLKVIYRIGGWTFNDPLPLSIKWLYILIEKFTARFKDIIILNNKRDFYQAKNLGITPRFSTEIIYNGVQLDELDFAGRELARKEITKNFKGEFKFIIGTLANFYKTKGLEHLIRAASLIPAEESVGFIIYGDGKERDNLASLIKQLGLENKVVMPGHELFARRWLPGLDIFVLPSIKEGSPWAVLEAMGAKLPIIATDVGGVPEMVENGKSGIIVPPRDSKAIADSITSLLHRETFRKELGIEAHQRVIFKFTLDKMVKEIEALL